MPISSLTIFYLLVLANVAVYLLAIIGVIRARLRMEARVRSIEEAFAVLERALKASYPDLPEGFTWNEVVTRLKSTKQELDWWEIEYTLRKYEAYRYGGIAYSDVNVMAVLRLAMSLPRGERYVRGSKVQSN